MRRDSADGRGKGTENCICPDSMDVRPDGRVPSSDARCDAGLDRSLLLSKPFACGLPTIWTSTFIALGDLDRGVCWPEVCPSLWLSSASLSRTSLGRAWSSTSASHFWSLCRVKVQYSDANQALTTARPKEDNTVKMVMIALVVGICEKYED
jgi:hypothetical protein